MSRDGNCSLGTNTSNDTLAHIGANLLTNGLIFGLLLILFVVMQRKAIRLVNDIITDPSRNQASNPITGTLATFANPLFQSSTDNVNLRNINNEENDQNEDDTNINDTTEAKSDLESNMASMSSWSPGLASSPSTEEWSSLSSRFRRVLRMTDGELLAQSGLDALQYIRFQRHIIAYLVMVTLVSLFVMVPINVNGGLLDTEHFITFEKTTLANVKSDSDWLWVHVAISFLFFPLCIGVMRRFSTYVGFYEASIELSRTLIISNIPRENMDIEEIVDHLQASFPTSRISDIRLAFNVDQLEDIYTDWEETRRALYFCREQENSFNIRPVHGGACCSCLLCCVEPEDATQFYEERERILREDFRVERERTLNEPLGVVFVTFANMGMAKRVRDAFDRNHIDVITRPLSDIGVIAGTAPPSSRTMAPTTPATTSARLRPESWSVQYASTPDDVYWEHLHLMGRSLFLRRLAVNMGVFFLIIFVSTPEVLATQTQNVLHKLKIDVNIPVVVLDFLPTALLWLFSALLPMVVSSADQYLGHTTRSQENHAIMKKVFWFLLFMVVILPTFGFTTASAVIGFLTGNNASDADKWQCVFMPDSGAFFVNYLITSALTGIGLELTQVPEYVWYLINICWARSQAEQAAVEERLRSAFNFGEQYARLMLIFCVTMTFSISCPLVSPFGLLFFVLKHLVDRHNIVFVNKTSKVNNAIHSTAIGFVVASVLIMQLVTTVFLVIRSGDLNALSAQAKTAIVLFFISTNIVTAHVFSDTCKRLRPIVYLENNVWNDEEDNDYIYLPRTLMSEGELRRDERRKQRQSEPTFVEVNLHV